MPTYFAITNHQGRWEYVCAGSDPEEVFREAEEILLAQEVYPGEEETALSPNTETQMNDLRVVPEETAREYYHIAFTREFSEG